MASTTWFPEGEKIFLTSPWFSGKRLCYWETSSSLEVSIFHSNGDRLLFISGFPCKKYCIQSNWEMLWRIRPKYPNSFNSFTSLLGVYISPQLLVSDQPLIGVVSPDSSRPTDPLPLDARLALRWASLGRNSARCLSCSAARGKEVFVVIFTKMHIFRI